jgi:RNA polymerase-binding protein DksA
LEKLKNYRPSEKEPFMNDRQRDYFRAKLLAWKDEILRESRITLQTLQEENVNHPDLADRASSETDRAIELRARDRQRKLISKIDAALQLRLLRGDRRADLAETAGSPPDRDPLGGGAGAPRETREGLSGRVGFRPPRAVFLLTKTFSNEVDTAAR